MAEEELIDEQYQLVMCIASGTSSQVWEIVEKTSARHMAMKLLKNDVPEFKENKLVLKREADILKSFDHPMIVKFEKYSSNRDHTYFLMEHFRASNLKLQIKADLNKIQLKIRQLFEGICAALGHVHQRGYIHRDIKPDNILMNKVGEIRLCDFSLSSKPVTGMGKMLAGKLKTIQGTRTYIAPETIRKDQPTFQTDLYSLGILFFEVLTGRTPFQAPSPEELLTKHLRTEAPNPSEFNPNVSPEMDRIVAKMLKKKPTDRPATVDEVLNDLKRIRIFKEDIVDAVAHKKANEDNDALTMLSEARLDSRADAKLKEMLATNPDFAEKFKAEKASKAVKKKAAKAAEDVRIKAAEDVETARVKRMSPGEAAPAPAPAPAQPIPMQMPMQGYPPGFPYPQGFMPYPQGQMPMMPMPMPPGMGMPMPGMPQYPPQPQMAYPQQQMTAPPVAPIPQQVPSAPQISASPPAAPQKPPAAAAPQAAKPVNRPPAAAKPAAAQQPTTQPATRQPAAPKPPAQPPERQQPPAAAAKPFNSGPASRPAPPPQPPATAADLDFMTDLPDVL